jgi:hypothetical protein
MLNKKIYNTLKGLIFQYKTKDDYTSELTTIAEEFAIEFAEWIDKNHSSISLKDYSDKKKMLEMFKIEKELMKNE